MLGPGAFDFVVMGAGVAGLRAAVSLAQHGRVLVVTKESLSESNTHYAQGGIAVANTEGSDIALHLEDTLRAGDGLVDRAAAEVLVSEGPERVAELIAWGAQFDAADGKLLRTREGAHSLARILHAGGDATGAEISRALLAHARKQKRIEFAEWTMVTGLLKDGGRVTGVELASALAGELFAVKRVRARAVLIASGGAGQVYADTTNPEVATGDGIALALDAGADVADMEFYQFHPTAFSLEGAPRFLLSEALRGEGAYLRNARGERFMRGYHPLLELAPRDVVARAIARESVGIEANLSPVYLDMKHVQANLRERFPGISAFLAGYGLELGRDLIPVRPAAHYLMGGIRTDVHGRSSLAGLYAAGEAACTGVHGANRLASNSLLEGLVFGARAAQAMLEEPAAASEAAGDSVAAGRLTVEDEARVEAVITRLRTMMSAHAGLLREEGSLLSGLRQLAECEEELKCVAVGKGSRRLVEARSLVAVARAILQAALARTESRGAHFRSDHPTHDDVHFRKHSVQRGDGGVAFSASEQLVTQHSR